MRITSRTEYGLRAMVYLAALAGDRPAPLTQIAAAEGIPAPFLERILSRLREAGLVTATRGASGGYRLSREPAAVAVAEIVTALEGPLTLVECMQAGSTCAREDGCSSRAVWRRLGEAITAALEGISLADLIGEGLEPRDATAAGRAGRRAARRATR